MKTVLLHIAILFLSSCLWAQETISYDQAQDIFSETAKNYQKDYLYYTVKLASFKGHQNPVKEDESIGYFVKDGNTIYSYQLGIYTVQNKKFKVIVDSTERYVGITYSDTAQTSPYSSASPSYSKKYVKSIELLEKRQKKYITIYFIDGYSYSKIVTVLTKSNILESMELFLANDIVYEEKGKEQKDKAKIRITFFPMKGKKKGILEIEDILRIKNNEILLTPKFSKFELIDFRYEK